MSKIIIVEIINISIPILLVLYIFMFIIEIKICIKKKMINIILLIEFVLKPSLQPHP